ncbi:hypothetical protein NL676_029903 [Syzygium grande]|nr:hypothetical protein NL676_029903 [Syzygium grande]
MANQAEIAAMIDEKLKEHMNAMNEQIAATMSKMMSDLMAKQSNKSMLPLNRRFHLQPVMASARHKALAVNTNLTFQLDDVILTDTSVSLAAHVLHPPPNDENVKLPAKLDQSQLIAMGKEIESELKKGWYSESSSSGKRFTSKKEKEHAPEVNMTYVQKTPAQAPKLQFTTQQATSYRRQGQQDSRQHYKPRQFTPLPGTLSQVKVLGRKAKAFMPRLRQMDNPIRLVWDIIGWEAVNKATIVVEAEEE